MSGFFEKLLYFLRRWSLGQGQSGPFAERRT